MKSLRRAIAALVAVLGSVALLPSLAWASVPPDPGSRLSPPPAQTVVSHGSPLWTFAVVAACAALITAIAVVSVARRRRPSPRAKIA